MYRQVNLIKWEFTQVSKLLKYKIVRYLLYIIVSSLKYFYFTVCCMYL